MQPKRWGPFSGRQLTTMFIAVMIAVVLVPTTVWAVTTGSAVNIIDGTNANNKAAVDSTGHVEVNAGTLFGLVPTYSGGGSVNATLTPPSQSFNSGEQSEGAGGACHAIATAPPGKALIITEIREFIEPIVNGTTPTIMSLFAGNACTLASADQQYVKSGDVFSQVVPFVPGLALNSGKSLYVDVGFGGQVNLWVQGYLVPASQCDGGTGCG